METAVSRLAGAVMVPGLTEGHLPVHIRVPREFTFEHWDDAPIPSLYEAGPVHISGQIEFIGDRYQITRLEVSEPAGITHDILRSIALGQLVIDAVRKTEPDIIINANQSLRHKDSRFTIDETVFLMFHLARIAGENTNTAIAAELGISSSAAAQRVARLRKQGWLPPARKQGARR